MNSESTETFSAAATLPAARRRVKFHKDALKSKFTHRRPHLHHIEQQSSDGATASEQDLNERKKWFNKIFRHRRHSTGDTAELSDQALLQELEHYFSEDDIVDAQEEEEEGEDDDDEENHNMQLSKSGRLLSRLHIHSRGANSSFISCPNGGGSTSSSVQSTPSSCRSQASLSRSSSTGSNAGGMSRRSYRLKLDHALRRAHLARKTYGLNPTSCGTDSSEEGFDGFMMRPDEHDGEKLRSSDLYRSVVDEAKRTSSLDSSH